MFDSQPKIELRFFCLPFYINFRFKYIGLIFTFVAGGICRAQFSLAVRHAKYYYKKNFIWELFHCVHLGDQILGEGCYLTAR